MIENTGPVVTFNVSVPSVARIYDVFLGGKDNYASDREAAERILKVEPESALVARQNRAFLGRAVEFLVKERGIRQFLDIGSGLPTSGNVHQVAQAIAPESRIVYVDNDDVVMAHARALLNSTPEGRCGYIQSDLRDTRTIMRGAAEILDLTKPVAVLFIALLHFIPDQDDPWGITSRFMEAVPAGSYLALSHATPESFTNPAAKAMLDQIYKETASGGVTPRPKAEIERFFSGLEMTGPLDNITAYRPVTGATVSVRTLFYGGIAQKLN
jgi:S-adenosyl methyltransferase